MMAIRLASISRCSVTAFLTILSLKGGYLDDIGFNQLKAEVGVGFPTGAGIAVAHIEGGGDAAGSYLPEATSGTVAFPGTGNYSGKTFTPSSGASAASGHAIYVADMFYGNTVGSVSGFVSQSPGVTSVNCLSAGDWLDTGGLRPTSGLGQPQTPVVQSEFIQNHSYISYPQAGFTASTINDLLRRFDFAIDRDDFVACVGVNNDESLSGAAVPHLLAPAYNSLAVGRSDGKHSAGAVPTDVDGPGRTRPDIVAPGSKTSWATAMVSSSLALLASKAASSAGLAPAAQRPEVMKALLLAGATKGEFPTWTHTSTAPLDARYGAGEINVRHSWQILTAGNLPNSNVAFAAASGWHYPASTTAATRNWTFQVPATCVGRTFSAALTWHRKLADSSGAGFNPTPQTLAKLTLKLFHSTAFVAGALISESVSTIDNVQHLWVKNLAPGDYTLQVTNDLATDFGLAWRTELAPLAPKMAFSTSPSGVATFDLSELCSGANYRIESSVDLVLWSPEMTLTATSTTASWTKPNGFSPQRTFFRLIGL